jgi:nucleoside-triphosphatase THEP1
MNESALNHPPVIIITGERGAGKTSFLLSLINRCQEECLSADGILALASPESLPERYLLRHIHTGRPGKLEIEKYGYFQYQKYIYRKSRGQY